MVVEQQTWVTLVVFAGFGLAMMTYLATMKRDLKADISKVESKVDSKIDGLRAELGADIARLESQVADSRAEAKADHVDLKTDVGRLDGRLVALESRVHDIAIRLPATLTVAQPAGS